MRPPPDAVRLLRRLFLFAMGILGVGLIGVPVLAGSGAYALSETRVASTASSRSACSPGFVMP